MVKTRSSARVGGSASGSQAGLDSTPASASDKTRHRAGENGQRNQRKNNTKRQNAAAVAAAAGSPGGGNKDVSLPVLPVSRSLYQHPAVSAAYTHAAQDSRIMPVAPRQNSLYAHSMYQQYQQHAQSASLTPSMNHSPQPGIPPYPVHPDVRLKRLPFYDMLAEIMKPSSLVPTSAQRIQEASFYFHLTPQQATDIATGKDLVAMSNKLEYIVQAQLRFCLLETSCEQEDCFPPSVTVKINGKMCPLPNPIPTNKPGVEPKRPPRPVNITTLLKLSPTVANTMTISWAADFTRGYALCVSMVRKLTSNELLQRLKNKGTKNPDYTRSLIKEKLAEDYDCEIATTSLRVSLVCPLGKMRMQCPCRPSACPHLQCFDASLFLQMNERKPTWLCPVCDRPASYDTLVVDGYFQDVLSSQRLPSECNEIQLLKDGSWSVHVTPAQTSAPLSPPRASAAAAAAPANVQLISDDIEVIPVEASAPAAKRAAVADADEKPCVAPDVVDLCSDSDDDLPLKRKAPKADVHNNHLKFNNATGENTSVSSSGYQSPGGAATNSPQAIISLDSPSPPAPASPPAPPALSPPPTLPPSVSITPVEACGNGRASPLPAHQATLSRATWSAVSPAPPDPSAPAPASASAPATSESDNFRRY